MTLLRTRIIERIEPLPETPHGPRADVTARDIRGDQLSDPYTFTVCGCENLRAIREEAEAS